MFIDFFFFLKNRGIPISLKELLVLFQVLEAELAETNVERFYHLAKTVLIKKEKYLDRFDQLFGIYFKGISDLEEIETSIEEEWIKKLTNRNFTEEEKAMIEAMGGLDAVMERFKEIIEKQKKRHQGGNTWVGTGGTSPFGNGGYNPEGIRVGGESTHNRALKVWEKRKYKDYAEDVELNTRNIKVALKRLRLWAREGTEEELDLEGTIRSTAENGGLLDIKMQAEVRNNVKVLLFFDVGGSMDYHIELCSQLFSASRGAFKHLEYFYFHNCLYEDVWKNNDRRWEKRTTTFDVLNKFNSDYKVIIIGDASMSPYEILTKNGSVEHSNEEAGIIWLNRLKAKYKNIIWLNPIEESTWKYTQSIEIIREIFENKMFPLTLEGLGRAIKELQKTY